MLTIGLEKLCGFLSDPTTIKNHWTIKDRVLFGFINDVLHFTLNPAHSSTAWIPTACPWKWAQQIYSSSTYFIHIHILKKHHSTQTTCTVLEFTAFPRKNISKRSMIRYDETWSGTLSATSQDCSQKNCPKPCCDEKNMTVAYWLTLEKRIMMQEWFEKFLCTRADTVCCFLKVF